MDKKVIKNTSTPSQTWGIIMIIFAWFSTAFVFFPFRGPDSNLPLLTNARILAAILDIVLLLPLIYWIIILKLEKSDRYNITINTTVKSKFRYINGRYSGYRHSITAVGWFWGFNVSKEIFDSVNEGDKVEITYGKFSKFLQGIRKL